MSSTNKPLPQGGIEEIAVTTVFLFLAILAVIARFYSRYLQRKKISIDDYLIVAALVFTTGTVIVGYLLVLTGGVGIHMVDATPEQQAMALKLFVPAPLLWAISTFFVKLSILFFYVSIFTMPKLRTAVFIVITLTVAQMVAIFFESFLLCRPFAYTWDKTIPGGVCGSSTQAYLSIAIVNLTIDLFVVFLPMPVLWKLQMPVRKKMVISAILGLGLLICCLTAARIKSVLSLDPLDFTYSVVPDLVFGALEIELGIVNACLPLLRPVLNKLSGSEWDFATGWTRKTDMGDRSSKNQKGSGYVNHRSFDRLPDNIYPLSGVAPGASTNHSTARAHVDSFDDLEEGGPKHPGDIMVRKAFYISRTSLGAIGTAA